MRIKRALEFFFALVLVLTTFTVVPKADAATPAICNVTPEVFNTPGCYGYYTNAYFHDSTNGINGDQILFNTSNIDSMAIPLTDGTASNPQSFVTYIAGMLGTTGNPPYSNTYSYNKAGAAFLVDTFMNIGGGGSEGSVTQGITDAQNAFSAFSAKVIDYNDRGLINWDWVTSLGPGVTNTMHACTGSTPPTSCDNPHQVYTSGTGDSKDFAFFVNNDTESSNMITFKDPSGNGTIDYEIRRECGNLVGTSKSPPTVYPSYTLTPSITATSGGTTLTDGSYVQAGQPIDFDFKVDNTANGGVDDQATGIACSAHDYTATGWVALPTTPTTTGATPSGVTCTSTFNTGYTDLGTDASVTSAPNNTSICRSLIVNPGSSVNNVNGAQAWAEACVYVSSRPYFRVYGGDISAGNPQSNACSTTTKAAIVGWNNDTSGNGGYSGAGAQYAELAIDQIYDSASSLGDSTGAAAPPSGLAFANTTGSGDDYGGNFGSLPCMTNYYANASGNSFAGGSISSLTSGSYTATGPITINGSVAAGARVVLYVNGNVTITNTGSGGITYPASWTISNPPLFEIIASGNIYVDKGVTDLDGLYIAQNNGTSGTGTIYDCTNGSTPYTIDSTGSFNTACDTNLTVNGSFIADQIRLMRTSGTVESATSTEASGTNQAETFNYSPALWLGQPTVTTLPTNYDSITSLPPIL
ncbi:MAG TPA: hypothetical protein VMB52_04050 [Verrucomicrobiae bacterium]|nr:hypothetical protein [Verrucomicrobiae bacterium]